VTHPRRLRFGFDKFLTYGLNHNPTLPPRKYLTPKIWFVSERTSTGRRHIWGMRKQMSGIVAVFRRCIFIGVIYNFMSENCSILRIGPHHEGSVAQHLQLSIVNYYQGVNWQATKTTTNDESNDTIPIATISNTSELKVSNKYFSATILFEGIFKQSSCSKSEDTVRSEDGIILVFNDSNKNDIAGSFVSFDSLHHWHEQSKEQNMAGDLLRLCVGVHFGFKRTYESDKEEQDEYARRILWCLDRGYEYVEADLSTQGVMSGHDLREKDGFPRIVEAISGTVWTSAVMATSKLSQLKLSYENDRNETTVYDNKVPEKEKITVSDNDHEMINLTKETDDITIVDDSKKNQSTNLVSELYLDEDEIHIDNDTLRQRQTDMKEERQVECMEGAFREARQIRDLSISGTLSDTERRQRAGNAATILLNLMGLDGDESDNDDIEN
jgi:hypothetical protein